MAQRRMTSLEVIDTDAFMDMPVSCQNLYFHLNARADDDGFVSNPKKIVRALGAAPDDLKVLIAKKFIIDFSDGVCVVKHWRINNFIRKDIYKETKYLDLKQTLFIRANGAYTQSYDDRAIPVPRGHYRIEDVDATLTKRQLSIGKVSIGKERRDTPMGESEYSPEFLSFWSAYPKKTGKGEAYRSWNKLKPSKELSERIVASVLAHAKSKDWTKDDGKYTPLPATFLNQKRYDDEISVAPLKANNDKYASY